MSGTIVTTSLITQTAAFIGPIAGAAAGAGAALAVTVAGHSAMKHTLNQMCSAALQQLLRLQQNFPEEGNRLGPVRLQLEQLQKDISGLKTPVLSRLREKPEETQLDETGKSAETLLACYEQLKTAAARVHGIEGRLERLKRIRRRSAALQQKAAQCTPGNREIKELAEALSRALEQGDAEPELLHPQLQQLEMLLYRQQRIARNPAEMSLQDSGATPLPAYLADRLAGLLDRPENGRSEKARSCRRALLNLTGTDPDSWELKQIALLSEKLEQELDRIREAARRNRTELAHLHELAAELNLYQELDDPVLSAEIIGFFNNLSRLETETEADHPEPEDIQDRIIALKQQFQRVQTLCYQTRQSVAAQEGLFVLLMEEITAAGMDPELPEEETAAGRCLIQEFTLSPELRVRLTLNRQLQSAWELLYRTGEEEITDGQLEEIAQLYYPWHSKLKEIERQLQRCGVEIPEQQEVELQKHCILIDRRPQETEHSSQRKTALRQELRRKTNPF